VVRAAAPMGEMEMELREMTKRSIVDCHTHFGGEHLDQIDDLLAAEREGGVHRLALMVTSVPGRANENAQAIYAKYRHPESVYVFAGMDYAAVSEDVDHRLTYPFPQQIDRLLALGVDGVKLINGKPDARKNSGIALDSVLYEGFYARAEALQLPLLWHVSDPEEFWDPAAAPEWASSHGWCYDASFPTNVQLYQEVAHVLARHPNLKVVFAHFCFLSDFLDRAAALLDEYPGVNLDLAPGIEMLHNFSKRPDEARGFFLRYQDRILYGTDLSCGTEWSPGLKLSRIWVVRSFLETGETFHVPTDDSLVWPDHRTMIRGIKLPEEVLAKVYVGNFARLTSPAPRPLCLPRVVEELNRLTAIHDAAGVRPNMPRRVADRLEQPRG
jgi:predicted TIM-barrel fold metal-dependent hydrolase